MNRIQQISSRDNQKLKFVRAVRDGREASKIFVEGLRLCEEIFKTPIKIQFVCFTSKFLQTARGQTLIELISTRKAELFEVEERIFDTLSDTKTSQGIILIADKPEVGKEVIERCLSNNPLLLLLHKLNNPSNLGAILRTAEAVGVEGVITTKGTTDVFAAKALRSGLGANLRLPFWINAQYSEVIEWAKEKNIKSVCADIRSNKSYLEIDWKTPKLLVIGSEGHGLTDFEQNLTDESLVIPMANEVESLNAAVACGVILFETKRQRNP